MALLETQMHGDVGERGESPVASPTLQGMITGVTRCHDHWSYQM